MDQVLVRWSSGSLPDCWEDKDEMIQRFPFAVAWSQVVPGGNGEGVLATLLPLGCQPMKTSAQYNKWPDAATL